jgi:hypothetical protein
MNPALVSRPSARPDVQIGCAAGLRARAGTQGGSTCREDRYCASHALRWVPVLVPLGLKKPSLRSTGTRE